MLQTRGWGIIAMSFLFLLLIASCTPEPATVSLEEVNLKNICRNQWNGIIPGQTNESEALAILKSQSSVEDGSIRTFRVAENIERVDWKQSGAILARSWGTMLIGDGTVVSLRVPVQGNISLQRWIDECGAPEQIRASRDGESPFAWLELFYPQKGWLVVARQENSNDAHVTIAPDAKILEIEYFTPTSLANYLAHIRFINNEEIREKIKNEFCPWPGINGVIEVQPY